MSNNKSNECNTIFDDTYWLYKYIIGIDYYHIRTEMKREAYKKEKSQIKVVNVMTLTLSYTSII